MRRFLARLICPEIFASFERSESQRLYLRSRVEELEHWCGLEFPQLGAAAQWIKKSYRVHSMSSAEYIEICAAKRFDEINVGSIDQFREEMRAKYARKEAIGERA